MRFAIAAAVFALTACASAAPRVPFSVDALIADASAYVAARYRPGELPVALIADLEAAQFRCEHSATMSACSRSQHAYASCWTVETVRIEAERVRAERNTRCMGVTQ